MAEFLSYAQLLKEIAAKQVTQTRSAISHRGEKGRVFEHVARGMLRPFLPKRFALGTGFIVGADGAQSHQTDIVVYDEIMNTPMFLSGDVGVFPIECVYAAIEVKSWIDREAVRTAAEAIGAIRDLKHGKTFRIVAASGDMVTVNVPVAPRSYFFAFDAKGGISLESLVEDVKEFSAQHNAVFHGVYVQEQDWVVRQVKDGNATRTKHHGSESWSWFVRYLLRDLSTFAMFPADMERYLGPTD
jgi:hypothetical protein